MDNINKDNILYTFYGSILSAFISRILLYPIDCIKTNKQVEIKNNNKIFSKCNFNKLFFYSLINKYGIRNLYKGFFFTLITTIPATSLYFCSFEFFKLTLNNFKRKNNENGIKTNESYNYLNSFDFFYLGFLAELVSCILFVPIDVIKEKMQTQEFLKLKRYNTSIQLLKDIINKDGFIKLYKGYYSTLFSFGIFSGLFFSIQNIGKNLMNKYEIENNYINDLKLNILSSFISSFITNPIDIVKIRYQVQEKNKTVFYYNNLIEGLIKLRKENIFAIYKGSFYRCILLCLNVSINITIINIIKNELIKLNK